MIAVCSDEDFDNRLLAGLKRRWSGFDYERAVDAGLAGARDSEVLEWAAREGRVLLTQDAKTMIAASLARVRDGLRMPGVIVVPQSLALGLAIEELELLLRTTAAAELENRVFRLPL